ELKGDRLRTSRLDVGIKLNREKETINIDNLQIKSDWAFVTAGGVVPTTFKSFGDFFQADSNYNLKGNFNCDLAAVLSQMPKTLGLKEGTQVTSGQLNGNVETSTRAGQRQIQAQGTLTGLEGTVKGKKIALSEPVRAQAQISSDKAGINFDKLDVSAPFAKINCTGTSELLKYNADVDLAKLQSELGQFINIGQYRMAGELLEKGQISIKEKKVTTSGTSVVKNLRFSSEEGVTASEPMANVAFALDIDTENSAIAVDSMRVDASFGRVSIKDAVLPWSKSSPEPLRLTISANNVDLNKLQPFAVLFASFPQQMQLAGIAESQISVSSKEDSYRIITEATKINNFKLISPGQEPFESNEVSLVFEAEVNPEQKAINVKKLQLESPQIRIEKGEFKQFNKAGKTKLEGLIDCEYDWSALSTVAGPFLPQGLKLQGQRKDTINFTSEYPSGQTDKLLANLSTKAKLGFENAQYMGLNFGPTDVDIQIQKGLLIIAPFATTVNDGQFNFAAHADFKQKPALLKTAEPMQIMKDIKINDETSRRLLVYLSPVFANAVNVSGIANFGCEQLTIPLSTAAKNQAEVVGTVSINKLHLQASDLLGQILSLVGEGASGQDFAIRPTRFVLQDGFLRYDDMQMDVGDNPINFTNAVIGLDKSYDMTIILPWTLSGNTARIGRDTGAERIELRLTARAGEKPELDLRKLLERQAIEKGMELLEGLFK
ncbi:MAG: translocation/assembly module TamB domain-containing protein, partial [Planctomycetota bacterium]